MVYHRLGNYSICFQGKSHKERDIPCQDSCLVKELSQGWYLSVVADGVGSCEFSDVGSSIAVDALYEYFIKKLQEQWNKNCVLDLCEMLREGYRHALDAIALDSDNNNRKIEEYDTTLTALLYNGENAVYGHSGDGGIIGMKEDGHYSRITQVQKGEVHNEVSPLRMKGSWVFGEVSEKYAGFLLMTDGVLDVALPSLLMKEEESIYVSFLMRFLNSEMPKQDNDILQYSKNNEEFLKGKVCAAITDDVSIIAIWNMDVECCKPEEDYTKEPDWKGLRRKQYYKLYPHLKTKAEHGDNDKEIKEDIKDI